MSHDSIFALHPELTPTQRAMLRGLSFEAAAQAVRDLEALNAAPRGAVRASRSAQATEIAERFGRATKPKEIHWDGNELVLERITPEQARELLAARGYTPPVRANLDAVRSALMSSTATAAGRPIR
jgi:hypothetical protein